MSDVRVAIIGCGARGRGHADCLAAVAGATIAAVCDPVEQQREAMASKHGVTAHYATPAELLAGEPLDAVVVAVPAEHNAAVALQCLQRGLATLVEKPPGLTVAETRQLQEAAAAGGAHCMVGLNRRFNPVINAARELVAERGPLVTLVGEFHKNLAQIERDGRLSEVVLAHAFHESPFHALDALRYLGGAPVAEVHGFARRAFSRHRDVFGALIVFENEVVCHFVSNYTSGARLERYELHGREISAYLEGVDSGTVVAADTVRELADGGGTRGTAEQAAYFVEQVRTGKPFGPPAADLEQALLSMQLADQVLGEQTG